MKITVFSYVFKPESFLINELCEALCERHSICVYTGLPNYPHGNLYEGYSFAGPYNENFGKIQVVRYPICPRKKGFLNLALNYLSHIFFSLINLFRLPKSDVYFVFATSPLLIAIPAILLKKIRPRPLIIWYQDLWPDSFVAVTKSSPHSLFVKFLESITRWIYKNTDIMMIQSMGFESNLIQHSYKGKIIHIPNWAPDFNPLFKSADWIQKYKKHKCLVTFAGNVGTAQDLKTLLDAATHLKDLDIGFLIVGDGRERESLQKRCLELELNNFYFPGKKDLKEMPALFEASDFLYLSLAKDELFSKTVPAKLQAYMSVSKPIIAAIDGEGSRTIAEAHCGYCGPAESVEELAKNLRKAYLLDDQARNAMGKNGNLYYLKNFEKSLVIKQIEDTLLNVQLKT